MIFFVEGMYLVDSIIQNNMYLSIILVNPEHSDLILWVPVEPYLNSLAIFDSAPLYTRFYRILRPNIYYLVYIQPQNTSLGF